MTNRQSSIADVCAMLDISNSCLYNLRLSDDTFPKGVKDVRGRVMFSKEEIEE